MENGWNDFPDVFLGFCSKMALKLGPETFFFYFHTKIEKEQSLWGSPY